MFGLFKKNSVTDEDLNFLKLIVSLIPEKYSYLSQQINRNFLVSKEPNSLGDPGTYVFSSDEKLGEKYFIHSLPNFFIIKGIKVYNKKLSEFEEIELHVHYGTLIGFKLLSKYKDLDLEKIDISDIKEKLFNDDVKEKLDKLLSNYSENELSFLDIYDAFKMEVEGNEYYMVKNLGDGNYLSVNTQGVVFGMIHDPYEIELLFKDFDVFLHAVQSGTFDVQQYISKKLS